MTVMIMHVKDLVKMTKSFNCFTLVFVLIRAGEIVNIQSPLHSLSEYLFEVSMII